MSHRAGDRENRGFPQQHDEWVNCFHLTTQRTDNERGGATPTKQREKSGRHTAAGRGGEQEAETEKPQPGPRDTEGRNNRAETPGTPAAGGGEVEKEGAEACTTAEKWKR